MTKQEPFSDQMRRLIETTGQTCYRISKATDIDNATHSRFVSGLGGLLNRKLYTFSAYLGWSIVVETKPAPNPRKAGK